MPGAHPVRACRCGKRRTNAAMSNAVIPLASAQSSLFPMPVSNTGKGADAEYSVRPESLSAMTHPTRPNWCHPVADRRVGRRPKFYRPTRTLCPDGSMVRDGTDRVPVNWCVTALTGSP